MVLFISFSFCFPKVCSLKYHADTLIMVLERVPSGFDGPLFGFENVAMVVHDGTLIEIRQDYLSPF